MSNLLLTVETFGSAAEAELAKNLLQVEGIAAYVMGGETANTLWHLGPALGGVKLQVAAGDLARARCVLAARFAEAAAGGADDYGLDVRPPARARLTPEEAEEDDEDTPEAEKDALARRAWQTAIIGVLLCPPLLNLLSLWMLLQLSAAEGTLSSAGRLKVVGALLVDALVLLAVLLFGVGMGALGNMRL